MTTTWKDTLKRLKLDHIKTKTPSAFIASGGYTMRLKPYNDNSTAGLIKCIVDWINYSGGNAIQISASGIRKEQVQLASGLHMSVVRFNGGQRKEPADIRACIQAKQILIKVDSKVTPQQKSSADNTIHLTVGTMQSFVDWYEKTFIKTEVL